MLLASMLSTKEQPFGQQRLPAAVDGWDKAGSLDGEGLWNPQKIEMVEGGCREALHVCSNANLGMRLGDKIWKIEVKAKVFKEHTQLSRSHGLSICWEPASVGDCFPVFFSSCVPSESCCSIQLASGHSMIPMFFVLTSARIYYITYRHLLYNF